MFRRFIDFIAYPFRVLFRLPMAIIAAPRRLLGMSLPTRSALLVAIVLTTSTIVVYITKLFFIERITDRWHLFTGATGVDWLIILGLLIFIPWLVHRAVKLWLEGAASDFPDIDRCWKEGLAALAQHGLDPMEIPMFLVLGPGDEAEVRHLFAASQLELSCGPVPQGRAPLHWYANSDAIFVVCTGTCRIARLTELAAGGSPVNRGRETPRQPDDARGTIVAAAASDPRETAAPAQPTPAASEAIADVPPRGTMIVGSDSMYGGGAALASQIVTLPTNEAAEFSARLNHICTLLNRTRQPLCPVNGVLTVLPFELIQRGSAEGVQVQRAIKADLDSLSRGLKLRCPVICLLGGMERESGFRELVRRIGAERAKAHRFGKGFNVWNPPIPEQIEAVVGHACKAFEDWSYLLFREKDGLSRPGNKKLYSLLCKVRSQVRRRLENIIVAAYADERQEGERDTEPEPLLFGGCYFSAIGSSEDRRAFVQSVFLKLIEEEEELEWSKEALAADERYHRLAQYGLVVDGMLLIGLIGVLAFMFMRP